MVVEAALQRGEDLDKSFVEASTRGEPHGRDERLGDLRFTGDEPLASRWEFVPREERSLAHLACTPSKQREDWPPSSPMVHEVALG